MTLASNPGNSVLSGTTSVDAVNGPAVFSDLTLNNPGTGYILQASSGSLTSVQTSGFDVSAVPPTSSVSATAAVQSRFVYR